MRLFSSALLLLSALPLALSASGDQKIVVHRWPISAGTDVKSQVPLGTIHYTPSTLSAVFKPTKSKVAVEKDELYRVGATINQQAVGSVRSGKLLLPNVAATITLHVDENGEAFHIEYDAVELATGGSKPETQVVVIRPFPGAEPALNKPIVLSPDGKLPVKEEEKTFLQKYWMFLAAGAILLVAAPAEGGK